jgi:hypothetical protein
MLLNQRPQFETLFAADATLPRGFRKILSDARELHRQIGKTLRQSTQGEAFRRTSFLPLAQQSSNLGRTKVDPLLQSIVSWDRLATILTELERQLMTTVDLAPADVEKVINELEVWIESTMREGYLLGWVVNESDEDPSEAAR